LIRLNYVDWGNIGEHLVKKAANWFSEGEKMKTNISKLPYRQGTQAYIANDKDELLLVCNVGKERFWKIPSGGIDKGEKPEDTIKREMMEELGVKIKILKRCSFKNKFDWPKEFVEKNNFRYRGQEQVIFIVKMLTGQKIKRDPAEVQDYKWIKFDKINDVLKLTHQQETAKKVLAEYKTIRKK